MYSQQHLDKILQLNKEYITASDQRRKQIEQQLIEMIPEQYKPGLEIQQMEQLQSELAEKINALAKISEQHDLESYYKQVAELQNNIEDYAKKLGVEFEKISYDDMMKKILEIKFGEQNENK